MKKVSATVIYKENSIYNLTINHKGNQTPLVRYDLYNGVKPYKYSSFNEVYKTVLKLLKNNNMYCAYVEQFGSKFYDIQWIDLDKPTEISKFGIKED